MKKYFLGLICLWISLSAGNFQEEFLEEVLSFARENPSEIVEYEEDFILKFYKKARQEATESDAKVRPTYVSAQGDFERTMAYFLSQGKIESLFGCIHTPTPATPLCTEGEVSLGLVDETMEEDSKRLFTVMKRPEIIRDFLKKGGKMVALYSKEGIHKRSEEQQETFYSTVKAYSPRLKDMPIPIEALPEDMVGATYFFSTSEGEWFAFAIQATQANAPKDERTWIMWFGPVTDPEVSHRIFRVSGWILSNGVFPLDDLPPEVHSQ